MRRCTPVTPSNSECNGKPPDFTPEEWYAGAGVVRFQNGAGIILMRYFDGVSTVQSRIRPIGKLGKRQPIVNKTIGRPETAYWCWKPVV